MKIRFILPVLLLLAAWPLAAQQKVILFDAAHAQTGNSDRSPHRPE
jgi:hypothetical protein